MKMRVVVVTIIVAFALTSCAQRKRHVFWTTRAEGVDLLLVSEPRRGWDFSSAYLEMWRDGFLEFRVPITRESDRSIPDYFVGAYFDSVEGRVRIRFQAAEQVYKDLPISLPVARGYLRSYDDEARCLFVDRSKASAGEIEDLQKFETMLARVRGD